MWTISAAIKHEYLDNRELGTLFLKDFPTISIYLALFPLFCASSSSSSKSSFALAARRRSQINITIIREKKQLDRGNIRSVILDIKP